MSGADATASWLMVRPAGKSASASASAASSAAWSTSSKIEGSEHTFTSVLRRRHSYVDRLELAERRLDVLDLQAFALAFDMAPARLLELLLEATKEADA